MGAMGVYVRIFPSYFLSDFLYSIAIAGLAISSVGALAGGFGFFAGNAPAFLRVSSYSPCYTRHCRDQ